MNNQNDNIVVSNNDVCKVSGFWNGEHFQGSRNISYTEFLKNAISTIAYVESFIKRRSKRFIVFLILWSIGVTVMFFTSFNIQHLLPYVPLSYYIFNFNTFMFVVGFIIAGIPAASSAFVIAKEIVSGFWTFFVAVIVFIAVLIFKIVTFPFSIYSIIKSNHNDAVYANSLRNQYKELI
ncbi:MAG: hypothetical protein LBV51_01110 [Acholeplasmatales bacterium]|jgi:hypothetical protein|nr:hypothetical protein [Acholeplasmatales bacterium]